MEANVGRTIKHGVAISLLGILIAFGLVVADSDIITLGYIGGSVRMPGDIFYDKHGLRISGAITYAVNEINNDSSILPNHVLKFVFAEMKGSEKLSIKVTSELPMTHNISAYIGPEETCITEGKIAWAYNLPMISYLCKEANVSDKTQYPTFARTTPPNSKISNSVAAFLLHFNWRKVVFLRTDRDPFMVGDTILQTLKRHNITVTKDLTFESPYTPGNVEIFDKLVERTYEMTRIYVVLADWYEFEGILEALQMRDLTGTGNYFVVGVHKKGDLDLDTSKYYEGYFGGIRNHTVHSFRHFAGIVHTPASSDFEKFSEQVWYYLRQPPFSFKYNFSRNQKGEMQVFKIPEGAAYLYDAVKLYASAAHDCIMQGLSPSNGTAILSKLYGRKYKSALGYMSRINANGDTEGNYSIIAQTVLPGDKNQEYGNIHRVGQFLLEDGELPSVHFDKNIKWLNGKPPVDEPTCGFQGEKCKSYTGEITGGVCGGILLVLGICAVILYRNWKYEQDLARLLWKIEYKDITVKQGSSKKVQNVLGVFQGYSMPSDVRKMSLFRTSQMSLASIDCGELGGARQIFTTVGTYKGNIVAIRKVNKRSIDLTRKVRKELKSMRDIRHDNLVQFIGACVDSPNICIVTEYCPKGSLEDVLQNDDVKLDDMFHASMVYDIIKGMIFLHESELRFHGNLKSSNCVVDSRWVLKLIDFGLNEFRAGSEDVYSDYARYRALLWTAPELLRSPTTDPQKIQKGDVYSFAVILYEIYGRNGPYGDIDKTPKEIIELVQDLDIEPPFRPKLSYLDTVSKVVTDCIKDCWQSEAELRPDFKIIRSKLRPIQKGMKTNILDNMVAIMEKYSTNLEEIVEERTDQLREEKAKTEQLLHRMLPRSVAEQLKRGKEVEAEAFDCVTIYFSDICGFTALSSESTPMWSTY